MSSHADKTYQEITGARMPHQLHWKDFVAMWQDRAEQVEDESGDRLAVTFNGHREVFRRPHDGRVTIEDVERARKLLTETPDPKGSGDLWAVTVDDKGGKLYHFDLNSQQVADSTRKVRDADPRGRHLRTVERQTGRDDEQDLKRFFDELAEVVQAETKGAQFVVLGHGKGKAAAFLGFTERVKQKHHQLAPQLVGIVDIDLSAARDADIEKAAMQAVAP